MVDIFIGWLCFALVAGILISVIRLITKSVKLQGANDRLRRDIDYLVVSNQLTAEEFLSHNQAIESYLNTHDIKGSND